jgi:dihydropyrimidinase
VAGGTTTIITFATQTRAEEDRSLIKVVETYNALAEETGSYVDYGFHIIIVRNDADVLENELPVLINDWGISSCKLFLTYETQRLTDSQLLDVMWAARKNSITTVSLLFKRRRTTANVIDDSCREWGYDFMAHT